MKFRKDKDRIFCANQSFQTLPLFAALTTALVLTVMGCNKPQKLSYSLTNCTSIRVNPLDTGNYMLSDFCKKKDFIFLEATDSSLISYIRKLIGSHDTYYLMTPTNRGQIFAFRSNGEFIKKYGKVGKGPGEYSELLDFSVDPENGHVYLLASNNRIIHLTEKLTWIEDIKLNNVPCFYELRRIAVFKGRLFFRVFSQHNFSLLIARKNGDFENFYFYSHPGSTASFRNFIVTADTLWYYRELSDTVYSFTGDDHRPKPYLQIDFGRNKYVSTNLYNYDDYRSGKNESMPEEDAMSAEINDIVFTKTTALCNYKLKRLGRYTGNYYSILSKSSLLYRSSPTKFFNDDFLSPLAFPVFISEDYNSFISVIYPLDILEKKEELIRKIGGKNFKENFRVLDSISNLITSNSNPFLFSFNPLIL